MPDRVVARRIGTTMALAALVTLGGCGGGEVAGPEPEKPTGTFDFLTYNVAGLPEGLSGSNPAVNIPLISPRLNGFDMALVQEDFAYHATLRAGALHLFQSIPSTEAPFFYSDLGDGLNRFSMLEVGALYRVPWEKCNGLLTCGSDCFTPKGFSMGPTLVNGIQVDVYNLHMDAGSCAEDVEARADQVRQLVSYMNTYSAGRALIVAGDFNMKDLPTTLTSGMKLTDACQRLACGDNRIDKVLFRSSSSLTLEPLIWAIPTGFVDGQGKDLSDHKPVAVRFRWTGG